MANVCRQIDRQKQGNGKGRIGCIRRIQSESVYIEAQGKSVNTSAFLLATMIKEGILVPVPDSQRHFELADTKPFLAEVEKLKAAHSKPVKAKPRAKTKAAARMPKKAKLPTTPSK